MRRGLARPLRRKTRLVPQKRLELQLDSINWLSLILFRTANTSALVQHSPSLKWKDPHTATAQMLCSQEPFENHLHFGRKRIQKLA